MKHKIFKSVILVFLLKNGDFDGYYTSTKCKKIFR